MDIGKVLNIKGNAADAQLRQQLDQAALRRSTSDLGSERSSASSMQHQPLHHMTNLPSDLSYSIDSQNQGLQMISNGFMPGALQEDNFTQAAESNTAQANSMKVAPKSFACSTCAKRFARRSDLARHERIHSGMRPHVCDHPGCGKQFIQRSALTVHARVHTGEKPHKCEICRKPFSDSSSLARHRRIHSGRKPYTCPYTSCQKTFTRRTTLTRHQNHHTGVIEEPVVNNNVRLQIKPSQSQPLMKEEDGSDTVSVRSSQSHSQRPTPMSPTQHLPPVPNLPRQTPDYYIPQNTSLPPHMRSDFTQQQPPRSSPSINPIHHSTNFNNGMHHRPSMTSHPANYGLPQPLEPPAIDTRSSGSGSPHMTVHGWGSPTHINMPSPGPMDHYAYPDPTYGGAPLYYPGSNIRRPQSTEPESYELRPRNMINHLPNPLAVGPDWSTMPVTMQPMN